MLDLPVGERQSGIIPSSLEIQHHDRAAFFSHPHPKKKKKTSYRQKRPSLVPSACLSACLPPVNGEIMATARHKSSQLKNMTPSIFFHPRFTALHLCVTRDGVEVWGRRGRWGAGGGSSPCHPDKAKDDKSTSRCCFLCDCTIHVFLEMSIHL